MRGRTPTKAEQAHMDRVRELNCIIFRNDLDIYDSPAAIHHVYGRTKEGAHFSVLPICYLHHQSGQNNIVYVSIHPNKAAFENRYGTEQELLIQVEELLT